MKLKDLTLDQQAHLLGVVGFCIIEGLSEQLKKATHLDTRTTRPSSLTKFKGGKEFCYDYKRATWGLVEVSTLSTFIYEKPEDYLILLTGTNQMTTKESKVTVQELKEDTFKPLKITLEILKEEDLLALIATLMPTDDNIEGCIKYESLLGEDTKGKFIKSLKSSTILDELLYVLETYNN